MHGDIAVESEASGGATFSFTVPLMPAASDESEQKFAAPDLRDQAVLIVAAAEIEASLLARRLGNWGAKTCAVIDETIAFALLPERRWDTVLGDFPLAARMISSGSVASLNVARRIVLIRRSGRHELPALKGAGF